MIHPRSMKGAYLSMKRIVCIVLAMMLLLASAAMAEEISITTGLATDHPAQIMVCQMDNEPPARPQHGIGSADIVYEIELYNGGHTRYTAVFNDNIPEKIEAVRSARIVNADIYTDYNGAFVHFGGQKYEGSSVYDYFGTINIGKRWDGIGYDNGSQSSDFYRDHSRKSPNNVICRLKNLHDRTDWDNITCRSPLKFGEYAVIPYAGEEVKKFSVPYRGSYTPSYVWDESIYRYLRFYNDKPFVDGATDEQVKVDNIIVQRMDYSWYAGESDRPKVATTGTNKCDYFMGGKHFTGYWVRDSISANTIYYDDNGEEVRFNPGVTFIQIIKTEYDIEILG